MYCARKFLLALVLEIAQYNPIRTNGGLIKALCQVTGPSPPQVVYLGGTVSLRRWMLEVV